MGIELIAALIAGFTLGGIVWILRRWTGELLPPWSVPFGAAVGLIGFTVWSEYDWFHRVSAQLPEGVEVVWAEPRGTPLRPWTYAAPIVTQFVALDTRGMGRHAADPGLVTAKLYSFRRWGGTVTAMVIVDCASGRQVMVTEGVRIDDDGILTGGDWAAAAPGDRSQQLACREV
ncbi:MAG: hypothetical protein JJT81_12635 [Rubellimicrobium sp.]|nr:hypothetical protein [Rubellimicrobium sp.]